MVVALLPGEKAGKICTVSAGSVRLEASLRARPGEDAPSPILPNPAPGVLYHGLREHGLGAERRLSLEVRSIRPTELAAAVDELLRAVSAHAALTGAVLETRIVRLREPLVPDALLLGSLARDLRGSSSFTVSFGPSWTPAPEAAVCVGTAGRQREIEHLLRGRPTWQPVPL